MSIDHIHNTLIDKFNLLKQSVTLLGNIGGDVHHISDKIDDMNDSYSLATIDHLVHYHSGLTSVIEDYKNTVIIENYHNRIDVIISEIKSVMHKLCIEKINKKDPIYDNIEKINRLLERIIKTRINIQYDKIIYDKCECGNYMIIQVEQSKLRCQNCNIVKSLHGVIFKDDQAVGQDNQRNKTNGYDTSRHYKFWIEHLQAIESKTFEQKILDNIAYVIKRDNYRPIELTCEIMRNILKDSKVNATYLNDHAPLLVKLFGGRPPPRLTMQENRIAASKFNRMMKLHDIVNPVGGNKPYYPYFIYQILNMMFADNPEKLRILDYIHLQSRETVIKNDKLYRKICKLAAPEDNFIYHPTDPAGRI